MSVVIVLLFDWLPLAAIPRIKRRRRSGGEVDGEGDFTLTYD
jgi:hypothetical protein